MNSNINNDDDQYFAQAYHVYRLFYEMLDNDPIRMMPIIHPQCEFVWDQISITKANLAQFLSELPQCAHKASSLTVHILSNDPVNILYNVHGNLLINNASCTFDHSIFMSEDSSLSPSTFVVTGFIAQLHTKQYEPLLEYADDENFINPPPTNNRPKYNNNNNNQSYNNNNNNQSYNNNNNHKKHYNNRHNNNNR